jgi:hypothetical protein
MSFIFCVALAATVTLANYLIAGNLNIAMSLFDNKALLLCAGVLIAYAHVVYARTTGHYDSVEQHSPPHWKAYLIAYGCVAALLLTGAVVVAFFN